MPTLDRSKAYTVTYGPDASYIPFFQDGFYFDRDGELCNIKHNELQCAARSIRFPYKDAPAPDTEVSENGVKDETPAVDPNDPLAGKSAAQVFAIAQKMRAQLDVSGDQDAY